MRVYINNGVVAIRFSVPAGDITLAQFLKNDYNRSSIPVLCLLQTSLVIIISY